MSRGCPTHEDPRYDTSTLLQSPGRGSIFIPDIRRDPRKRARQPGRTPKVPSPPARAGGETGPGGVNEETKSPARPLERRPRPPGVFFDEGEDPMPQTSPNL